LAKNRRRAGETSAAAKSAGDKVFVPKGLPVGIGNVLWRVE